MRCRQGSLYGCDLYHHLRGQVSTHLCCVPSVGFDERRFQRDRCAFREDTSASSLYGPSNWSKSPSGTEPGIVPGCMADGLTSRVNQLHVTWHSLQVQSNVHAREPAIRPTRSTAGVIFPVHIRKAFV